MDVQKLIPVTEVLEGFWSPEQSAFFVKCQMSQVKKHNVAIRTTIRLAVGKWTAGSNSPANCVA